MTTAALASLVLGLIMVGVILASRKYHINPDNVATPIAASLGDLVGAFVNASSFKASTRCSFYASGHGCQ